MGKDRRMGKERHMGKERRMPGRSGRPGSRAGGLAIVLVLLLWTALPLRAQAALECPPADLPLWEMSSGEGTVYLLGSIHMLRPDVYPLHDAFYEALDDVQLVAFELDFNEMATAAPLMAQRGMYDGASTLREALPEETYAELEGRFRELQVPVAVIRQLRPWMAALTLSSLVVQQGGYEAASGIDLHFFERARDADKEIIAFETMAEQIDVFDGMSEEGQVAFVQATLDGLDQALEQIDQMSELWERGDAARLAELLNESMEDQPELMERILYARNRNWVPQIEALLEGGRNAMVIVGMGHMIGEGSIIELLRENGHTVERWGTARCEAGARDAQRRRPVLLQGPSRRAP